MLFLLSLFLFSSAPEASTFCRRYEASSVWGQVVIQTESHYMVWDGDTLASHHTVIWGAVEASCAEPVEGRTVCGYWVWNLNPKPCQN